MPQGASIDLARYVLTYTSAVYTAHSRLQWLTSFCAAMQASMPLCNKRKFTIFFCKLCNTDGRAVPSGDNIQPAWDTIFKHITTTHKVPAATVNASVNDFGRREDNALRVQCGLCGPAEYCHLDTPADRNKLVKHLTNMHNISKAVARAAVDEAWKA